MLSKQQKKLEALLNPLMIVIKRPRFTLRKLPMWGEQVAVNQIDFEWPTQEMLDQMPADVSLRSLEFSSDN